MHFGRSAANRFDAPDGRFGVLYVARDAQGAFIEVFGRATGVRLLAQADIEACSLSEIRSTRPLRLVDLSGSGLAGIGADARLTSGDDYALAQRWSLALHVHPSGADGLLFRARHDPSRVAAVIFDRARGEIAAACAVASLVPIHECRSAAAGARRAQLQGGEAEGIAGLFRGFANAADGSVPPGRRGAAFVDGDSLGAPEQRSFLAALLDEYGFGWLD